MIPLEVVLARQKERVLAFESRQYDTGPPAVRKGYVKKGVRSRRAGAAPCWTPEDDMMVVELYREVGPVVLAERLDRTVRAVTQRANALGVYRYKRAGERR